MSDKPLKFEQISDDLISIINQHGDHCSSIDRRYPDHDYLFRGFTSERLLEIAVKMESLNSGGEL